MALNLNYGDRKIFWGASGLMIGTLATGSKVTNLNLVTGLTSIKKMESKSETANFAADDVPNHGSKTTAGALEGEISFLQLDVPVMQDFLGQIQTANKLGYVPTGKYTDKIVQYINKARKKMADGTLVDGYKITVFPALRATGESTSDSETDNEKGTDAIEYTIPVQGGSTPLYSSGGFKPSKMEYEVWGADADNFEKKMNAALFIVFPDTVITSA